MFHLAPAVSGECEADFDLGLRSNIDSTRAPLDALRFNVNLTKAAGGKPPRLVCSSSVAVFGPDPAVPLPKAVADDTLPAPQTSDGTHKLIGRHLVADCPRKRYIDGRAARLMTVTVRPCKQNGAASSFFSGIIREPLAGVESICPVDANVSLPVSSPTRPVEGLIAVFEASREAFNGRTAMNRPALNVRWSDMLDALARVAGWPGANGCASNATSASPASSPTGRAARRRRILRGSGWQRTPTSPRSSASASTTVRAHPTPTKA